MSDPVTNIDIEDVLTSIRRLVREGGGLSASQQADAGAAATPKSPSGEDPATRETPPPTRFVLTPALRVTEPAPAFASSANRNVPEALPERTPDIDILPEAEPLPQEGFDFDLTAIVGSDFAPDDAEVPTNRDTPDRRTRVSDTAAGLEVAVTASPDEWEPDGSEEVPVMDWAQATPEDAPVFRSRQSVPPLRRLAEVVISEAEFVPEQAFRHGGSQADVSLTAGETTDRPGTAAGAAAEAEPRSSFRDDLSALSGKDIAIDEEALRAMIIEIVRQELQGSLGERITRNVRKLVRREISRMMTIEEFE